MSLRILSVALLSLGIVVAVVAPAVAQVPAPAPAPKVTINGLVDFVVTAYKNWSGAGSAANPGGFDVTDGGRDQGVYSRQRGIFTITGEVGRSKGVWAIELDYTLGAGLNNAGNAFNGGQNGVAMPGTSANFDLDTDVASTVETKWLYVETPATGPGSFLPFIPVPSIVRVGAQPGAFHEYKFGLLFGGDFPGVTLRTTWAPNITSAVTYAQIGERLDRVMAPGATEDWAVLTSVEWEPMKGLVFKPTYAYASYDGGNCGAGNLGTPGAGGFTTNVCGTPGPTLYTRRHTFGGDMRWTSGPFTIQPTFLYQLGTQQVKTARGGEVDIRSFIFDTTAGYRVGPLNFETRVMYTPGMDAQHNVQNGADVGYYRPINPGFAYMIGWAEIQTTGQIDYTTAMLAGASGLTLRESASYDKYGRIFAALGVDYALTPALKLSGLVNASWTDKKVDTDGVITAATGLVPLNRGDSRYLGTEFNAGLTYRFAPNMAFDLIGAYFFAGSALDHARVTGGPVKDADDVYKVSSRVRITF